MKEVLRYQTMDGEEFTTYAAASRHAKQRYETLLDRISRDIYRLIHDQQFATPTTLCEYLDNEENTALLLNLFERRTDLHVCITHEEY